MRTIDTMTQSDSSVQLDFSHVFMSCHVSSHSELYVAQFRAGHASKKCDLWIQLASLTICISSSTPKIILHKAPTWAPRKFRHLRAKKVRKCTIPSSVAHAKTGSVSVLPKAVCIYNVYKFIYTLVSTGASQNCSKFPSLLPSLDSLCGQLAFNLDRTVGE